jgi:chemotaxis protein MotB
VRRGRDRRRRDSDGAPHADRWLVSYADFITLLFAFFVVMYALSSVNEGKYRVMSDALFSAFRNQRPAALPGPETSAAPSRASPASSFVRPAVRGTPANPAVAQREARLRTLAQRLGDALAPLVQSGQVRLTQTAAGLAVEINASVLFAPAQATLRPDSVEALSTVARMLADVDNAIEVQGHSDNVPMASAQYPSNWELASARASSVVRIFIDGGIAPGRLIASGYADNRPVDATDTPEGRARNRRVTVLIRTDAGALPTPLATLGPATPVTENRAGPAPVSGTAAATALPGN